MSEGIEKTCNNCGGYSVPNTCGGCKDKNMFFPRSGIIRRSLQVKLEAAEKLHRGHLKECKRLLEDQQARITQLEGALSDLMDEQNRPPLIRHKDHWQKAMDNATEALKDTP